ncbi:MAG: thermonuclease family protein [Candidatus Aenigmarchaeota archaeon]|nr:thermonuclease family protein [Candidatus Aenigmarchaeota archaeon]
MLNLSENKLFFAIIFAATILFYIFLSFSLNNNPSTTGYAINGINGEKMITKVIDGDTVIIEGGRSVRLLGIDADEKGYPCYSPAKKRLEELVLNKKVYLEADKEDQYKRYLGYLTLDGKNINLKLVQEGFAIARFSPEDIKYKEEIIRAEKKAMENGIGCKWT